ncbi:MAG: FimB/Mfa2 family fimbrial subunit [Proteiniphilum sp.]|jgi:hypothetical protein|nr:FimB/Mfa2 family fimbrial subunit [Proteiniphilum sp.]
MTVKRITNIPLHLLFLLALTASFAGCLKENLEDCLSITVQAHDRSSDVELDTNNIKDLSLFLFNNDFRFMYKIDASMKKKVTILGNRDRELYIVAWGNLRQGSQTFTDPRPGDLLTDCFVELRSRTRATASPYVDSPDDLFRGGITIAGSKSKGGKVISMYREVGSMTVTLRNLKSFTGYDDNNFRMVVRETPSMMNFNGKMTGDMIAYLPVVSLVNNRNTEEYHVPPFNMFPKEGVMIDVFHGDELIATVSKDSSTGNSINVKRGGLTNVLIDLKSAVNVSVEMTEWGRLYMWKEF